MWATTSRRRLVLIPLLAAFGIGSTSAPAARQEKAHYLHAIIFESYLTPSTKLAGAFDTVEMPSNDFPQKFSRLLAPSNKPQTIELPSDLVLPKEPMFLDIFTFAITDAQIHNKKRLSRYNGLQRLDYGIRFLSWSSDRYQAEIEGRYEDFKFRQITINAAANKTTIVRIRCTARRTLYAALTPIAPIDQTLSDVSPPRPVAKPLPVYPALLASTHWSGTVRIHAVVNQEGRISRDWFILLECPHHLLAWNSLDVVLNEWTFQPAHLCRGNPAIQPGSPPLSPHRLHAVGGGGVQELFILHLRDPSM